MKPILTKKQLKKRNDQILAWLNKLVSVKATKDLLEPVKLGYAPWGTEAGSTLYLTKRGIVLEHWDTIYGLCDRSTERYERKVNKTELKHIVLEEADAYKLNPEKLEKLYAQLIA